MVATTAHGYPYPEGSDTVGTYPPTAKALADEIEADFYPPIRLVDAAGEPAFENNWVNFGGVYLPAGFRKVGDQVVLQGSVKNPALGNTSIFTLPVGYRPAADVRFATTSNNTIASIAITAAGVVDVLIGYTPANAQLPLDAIRFRAV